MKLDQRLFTRQCLHGGDSADALRYTRSQADSGGFGKILDYPDSGKRSACARGPKQVTSCDHRSSPQRFAEAMPVITGASDIFI